MEGMTMMQKRIEIYCSAHPEQLPIGTLTDSRRDVGDKAEFVAGAMANLARLEPEQTHKHQAIALGLYDVATRISYLESKTRLTNSGLLYSTEFKTIWAEETNQGRYFHFLCHLCGKPVNWTEARVTKFVDGLHRAGVSRFDLAAMH